MYCRGAMSQSPSTDSTSFSAGPDAISRRAYELWEKEGRPEGSDLRHWLQAEQELGIGRADNGQRPDNSNASRSEESNSAPRTDAQPLQGTRAGAAANREPKRGTPSPFGEKSTNANGRKKAASTPVM